jgi:Lysyl oxidase
MVLSTVLSLGVVLLAPIVGRGSATAASQLLPDMRIAKLTTIKQDTTTIAGHRLLRYTATIVNVGAGHAEVEGTRPDTSTPTMSVTQRIYDDAANWTDVPTGTHAFWAGDGHDHWHLFEMAGAFLTPFGGGVHMGTSAKEGFHFSDVTPFDLSLPNAPQTKRYKACIGNNSCKPDALFIAEGIAVGWGDLYRAGIMFQWIDITGVANGKYVLTVTADPHGYLQESDNTNNTASATIRITSTSVNVLSYSGGA